MNFRNRHILVVSHAWYEDVIGGAFRLASEFAEYLALTGNRVSFVCCASSSETSVPEREEIRGVHVIRYRPDHVRRNGLARLRFHVRQTEKMVRQIQIDNPIAAISGHSPLQMLGALRAVGKGVFSNYTVHSPFDDELSSNNGGGLMSRLAVRAARWVDHRIILNCTRMQTDSAYTWQSMVRKYGGGAAIKGIVAPGWVEADRFLPAANRANLRNSLGPVWETDVPVFFTLRRLENRMGLDTLVSAGEYLRREGLNFRILIGGGGSLRGALQQQIDVAGLQNCVILLGRLPEEQLASAYAAADCFVLPTRALECFGLIVLEAFACNTPVIASRVAAIPELAERQGTEWMFEPGNVNQLADRMRAFITGKLKPSTDLRRVAMEYDKPKVLERWEKLLHESMVISSTDPCSA